jgi:hypothetical protein
MYTPYACPYKRALEHTRSRLISKINRRRKLKRTQHPCQPTLPHVALPNLLYARKFNGRKQSNTASSCMPHQFQFLSERAVQVKQGRFASSSSWDLHAGYQKHSLLPSRRREAVWYDRRGEQGTLISVGAGR